MTSRDALIGELESARAGFFTALETIDPRSLDAPGLVGEWSARELVAHVGYWVGHAVEAIHAVESGRAGEFGAGRPPVDEVNETVARVARQTDLTTARKRETASFDALVTRLRQLNPALLSTELPRHELTLEQAIREDSVDHYREHTEQLRATAP